MEKELLERIIRLGDVEFPQTKDKIKRLRKLPNFFDLPEYKEVKLELKKLFIEFSEALEQLNELLKKGVITCWEED